MLIGIGYNKVFRVILLVFFDFLKFIYGLSKCYELKSLAP